jgi:hypothetical protein
MMIYTPILKFSVVFSVVLISFAAGDFFRTHDSPLLAVASEKIIPSSLVIINAERQARSLDTLLDGSYQFCSQPEPSDWHDGAGVCLTFNKVGDHIEGYYGYPHSDRFICLQGGIVGNRITGDAMAISWPGVQWREIPTSAFAWDDEAHLTLAQGEIIHSTGEPSLIEDWILFHSAILNVDGFYQYSRPRMNPPSAVCNFP